MCTVYTSKLGMNLTQGLSELSQEIYSNSDVKLSESKTNREESTITFEKSRLNTDYILSMLKSYLLIFLYI